MEDNKSLDYSEVIANLITDVYTSVLGVSASRAIKLTIAKVRNRMAREGIGLLTKTFPRLGRDFDVALTGAKPLNYTGVRKGSNSQLPILFGELFQRVFSLDGWVLPTPCTESVRSLRELLYCFYKYELQNDPKLDQAVLDNFKEVEADLRNSDLNLLERLIEGNPEDVMVARVAKVRALLERVVRNFNWQDISPRHGPGAVATGEEHEEKYLMTRTNPRLDRLFPFDAYFMASQGHVCDSLPLKYELSEELAKVCLVPKDSRGPRLISCEPLEVQWIQQGVAKELKRWIEHHPLTKGAVNFTDQQPNRNAAFAGSIDGSIATLDLKEASDRISMQLVELLYPSEFTRVLKCTRSLGTIMPTGEELLLAKFAPMGSALCFPILALTTWAILYAGLHDTDARKRILVYGDDVIVPTAHAADAIEQLESFGLKVNRMKSCTSGFFRESCGMDAFHGVDVTPVRFRTVWSSIPAAAPYVSWIAYANSLHDRGYTRTSRYIIERLEAVYGIVPSNKESLSYPCLTAYSSTAERIRTRWNSALQRVERRVWVIEPRQLVALIPGWNRLLRYFAEDPSQAVLDPSQHRSPIEAFSPRLDWNSRTYTYRDRVNLRLRWR